GLAAPMLLFPSSLTPAGLVLIGAGWVIRRAVNGQWSVSSPAHRPVLVLLAALLLSLIPSVRLDFSAPKFWGVVLGIAIFYACLNTAHADQVIGRAILIVLGAGMLMVMMGVWGVEAPTKNIFFSPDLYSAFLRRGAV